VISKPRYWSSASLRASELAFATARSLCVFKRRLLVGRPNQFRLFVVVTGTRKVAGTDEVLLCEPLVMSVRDARLSRAGDRDGARKIYIKAAHHCASA
jgi:hypothetical protein